ncbi:hypothetical protein NXX82_22665 [Bacteroides fragilis]|nr:hypothetical protein [Bacteroides fragilis]
MSSCGNEWLDRKPADGIPSEDAITNYNDALTARTGMYDGIQETPMLQLLWCPYVFITAMFVLTYAGKNSRYAFIIVLMEMLYTIDDAPNMWNILYNVNPSWPTV